MNPVESSVSAAQRAQNRKDFLAQPGVNDKIKAIAKNLGISTDEILAAIETETAGSYSSAQRNLGDGRAVGLIQFYPDSADVDYKTIGGVKYETSDLEKMTELQQLDLVEIYLENQFKNKGGQPGELYVSIAYPALVGADPSTEIPTSEQARVAKQNAGWVDKETGLITKASISSFGGGDVFADAYDLGSFNETQKGVFENFIKKINDSDKTFQEKRALKDEAYARTKSLDAKDLRAVQGALSLSVESLNIGMQSDARFGAIEQARGIVTDVNADPRVRLKAKELIDAYDAIPETGAQFQEKGFFQAPILGFAPKDTSRDAEFDAKRKDLRQQIFEFTQGISEPKTLKKTPTPPTTQPAAPEVELPERKKFVFDDYLKDKSEGYISEKRKEAKEFYKESFVQPGDPMMSDAATGEVTGGTRRDKLNLTIQKVKEKLPEKTLNVLKGLANNVDKAMFALSAGAGIKNLFEATERDEVTKSYVSPLFKEALMKTRQASEEGMPYAEKQAALKDIASAYSGAMKNVMAMSGGQRGLALSNAGIADATRVNALVDLAAKGADIRQKNLALYAETAKAYGQQQLTADMTNEKMKQNLDQSIRNNKLNIGLGLFKEATEYTRNYMDIKGFVNADKTDTTSSGQQDNVALENINKELEGIN